MQKLNQHQLVCNRIKLLELKQANEMMAIKYQTNVVLDDMNPLQHLKKVFLGGDETNEPIQKDLLKSVMSVSSGFIIKKIFMGKSHSPLKSLLGSFLEVFIANYLDGRLKNRK